MNPIALRKAKIIYMYFNPFALRNRVKQAYILPLTARENNRLMWNIDRLDFVCETLSPAEMSIHWPVVHCHVAFE